MKIENKYFTVSQSSRDTYCDSLTLKDIDRGLARAGESDVYGRLLVALAEDSAWAENRRSDASYAPYGGDPLGRAGKSQKDGFFRRLGLQLKGALTRLKNRPSIKIVQYR